jgi:hypothetical protein
MAWLWAFVTAGPVWPAAWFCACLVNDLSRIVALRGFAGAAISAALMATFETMSARLSALYFLDGFSHVTGNIPFVTAAEWYSRYKDPAIDIAQVLGGMAWKLFSDVTAWESHLPDWELAVTTRFAAGHRTGVIA